MTFLKHMHFKIYYIVSKVIRIVIYGNSGSKIKQILTSK